MTESQNLVAESQISDTSQPIGDGLDMVGAPVDAIEVATDVKVNAVELGSGGRELVRKRRGRPSKAQAKPPLAKKNKEVVVVPEEDEDVCFICFDGGSLVLCDRKGCPKAYHPACIKRDEAFFESAAKWNCGWHICSICQKTAHHMCYTCTYSLCRGCIRKADYVCVRGDKGFCTICMKTIMLIENNGQGEDGKIQADFDDKLSWEYLFKVYWVYIKGKLSLTVDELTQAKNPWKEASTTTTTTTTTISSSLPTHGVHKPISVDNLEENESKRRKIDEHVDIPIPIPPKENLNLENVKSEQIENATAKVVKCKEWATKELLEFISHMKNGNTSVLSRFDVQALMMEYINTNNLRDPKNKNRIVCDSRLENMFKKPRVGHIQIWKLLEHHFLVKEKSRKTRVVKRASVQDDADWTCENGLTIGKDKKRKNRSKGDERQLQNKVDDFAAVDVYNMNLIYLRRDLMENLLEDCENFHNKVVGSIVRVKILGSDLKHDMYRLVQVVGTSKVDAPYKIDKKLTDFMLEVLNLDKKETISIDNVSDQDFSEEECRRLQQSIKCGLVQHFTVGEIQEKAVALQSLKLNDWMEKETLRLTRLRDLATEKGHKKGYKECVEKLQLLKTPDERERILQQIPQVHSDRKMNPHYESDDTEEYFNKEHGDQMESKHSIVGTKKRRARSNNSDTKSQKDEKAPLIMETETTKSTERINMEKDATVSTLVNNSELEIDCNNSTITKLDQQPTISSSVSNIPPETTTTPATNATSSSPDDVVWHYLDPNGRVQGPFSLLQLQRWNTTGYFPIDMRIWANHEDKTVLLIDVLKDQFDNYESTTATVKVKVVSNQTENVNVSSAIPSDAPNSSGQNWSATNNPKNVELKNPIEAETDNNNNHVSVPTPVVDLPGPKLVNGVDQIQPVPDSKLVVQDSGNPPSWSSASSLVIGGPTKLPVSNEWVESFKQPLEIAGDLNVATPTSNIDQNVDNNNNNNNINININIDIDNQSQAMCNDFTTWQGMGEMIEFSTLAEESVSDLLAEVDAMESQYGLPSPTSRRNSFVDDLFNGSFDEFSPTPDQGTRSDGFSSSGDIQLPAQSTDEQQHLVGFDFMKTSFKWPEMIDINRSAKGEGDEGEMEMKTSDNKSHVQVKVENGNLNLQNVGFSGQIKSNDGLFVEPMKETKSIGAKLVNRVAQIKGFDGSTNHRRPKNEEDGEFVKPQPLPPPPPLTLGLDPFDPNDLESEGKFSHTSQSRNDPNPSPNLNLNQSQGRVNSSSNSQSQSQSPRERRHDVERSSRRSSLGGSGSGSRPPVKGGQQQQQQRLCRFNENGRCKKGASCRYLHSSPAG